MTSNRLQFTRSVWAALAVTLLLWASAYAGIRAGLRGYSPADLAHCVSLPLLSHWAFTRSSLISAGLLAKIFRD